MTIQPTMNKTDRIVKIAEVNGHIYIDGGFHPHFQDDIKANLDAQFHKEKKIWYVKADRAAELDALIETYFPTATIQDHRKKPVQSNETNTNLIDLLKSQGHIVNLKGKNYILFAGLLLLAHENGLESITTDSVVLNPDKQTAVFIATVKGSRGEYTGHGDANPSNVSKMMLPSYIRMAETRAIARALRFYIGIGMTAREELPG
jgi:hypothetical protein